MPDLLSTDPAPRHVFVYGTLRRGECNDINLLQPPPAFVGDATVMAVLYHLGDYPGVVLGGEVEVTGEVYAISPELEVVLDHIEGISDAAEDEYAKRMLNVQVGGQTLPCLVYELSPHMVANRAAIENGDWVRFRAAGSGTGGFHDR